MSSRYQVAIVSDIHYASAAEQARGDDYETRGIVQRGRRLALRAYRDYIWLRHPLRHNHLLDRFLAETGAADFAVANGDYTCDSAFIGVADNAACASVRECLGKIGGQFGARWRAVMGDHELGKKSLFGDRGNMHLASYERAVGELGLRPFWQVDLGRWRLLVVTSSLIAFPHFAADALPEEQAGWQALREAHLAEIRAALAALPRDRRVLLFCHDPTALPFLLREAAVRAVLPQLEQTIIGHLHTPLVLWKSRLLSGMPRIGFLGHTARRLTAALSEARDWKSFKVRLCPALAGTELFKDGGYLTATLAAEGTAPARFEFHPLRR